MHTHATFKNEMMNKNNKNKNNNNIRVFGRLANECQ